MCPRKVLIVDDDSDTAKSTAEMLVKEGWEAAVAYDGREAILRLLNFGPQILVLDLAMPIMDGWDVIRWVEEQRANGKQKDLKVIVLTAAPPEGVPHGVERVLIKPVDMAELKKALDGLIQQESTP